MTDQPDASVPAKAMSGMKGAAITVAQVMTNPKAYLNWRAWWLGLYSNSVTAGAAAITTWLSSNGLEGVADSIPWDGLHKAIDGVGMGWKTALAQFGLHVIAAAMKYISETKGLPPGVSASPFSFQKPAE